MKNDRSIIQEMKLQVKLMEKTYSVLNSRIKVLASTDPEREQCELERQILWAKCDMLECMIEKFEPKRKLTWKFKFRKIWNILWA